MRTGRDQLRAALALHAASAGGVLVGEAVGVAGLSKGLTGNLLRTPLSEAGSVGAAVGLALAGGVNVTATMMYQTMFCSGYAPIKEVPNARVTFRLADAPVDRQVQSML